MQWYNVDLICKLPSPIVLVMGICISSHYQLWKFLFRCCWTSSKAVLSLFSRSQENGRLYSFLYPDTHFRVGFISSWLHVFNIFEHWSIYSQILLKNIYFLLGVNGLGVLMEKKNLLIFDRVIAPFQCFGKWLLPLVPFLHQILLMNFTDS